MNAINSKTIVINMPDKFHKYNRVRELRTFSQNQRLKLAAVVNTAVSLHSLANLRASLFLSLVLAGGTLSWRTSLRRCPTNGRMELPRSTGAGGNARTHGSAQILGEAHRCGMGVREKLHPTHSASSLCCAWLAQVRPDIQ